MRTELAQGHLGKLLVGTLILLSTLFVLAYYPRERSYESLADNTQSNRKKSQEAYGKLPLSFEINQGQADQQVKFLSRGNGYNLFLTPAEVVLSLSNRDKSAALLRMQLAGANPAGELIGMEELPGKSNYFIGNNASQWHTNISHYARVRYQSIYPGID